MATIDLVPRPDLIVGKPMTDGEVVRAVARETAPATRRPRKPKS
jgi:hypothetical protein